VPGSELYLEIGHVKAPYDAILDAGVARLRAVLLVVVTTVLGMLPAGHRRVLRRHGGDHYVRPGVGAARLTIIAVPVLVRDLLQGARGAGCHDALNLAHGGAMLTKLRCNTRYAS